VVEDQSSTRKMMAEFLSGVGYEVYEAWSLDTAERICSVSTPDIILLDILLENQDGLDFLRNHNHDCHVIVVSQLSGAVDRVLALELGADDYLVKPIELRELSLRIRNFEKKRLMQVYPSTVLQFEDLSLDLVSRCIFRDERNSIALTRAEFILMKLLIEKSGETITRALISKMVLGHNVVVESRAVDVLVSKSRSKLRKLGVKVEIRNVRYRGYGLQASS
jgi:two-component system torCAD operon response regulator TorR